MTVTFCSNQDYDTKAASIAAISLRGSADHKAWRAETFRCSVNDDYAWFTYKLHGAMGYRADQPEM